MVWGLTAVHGTRTDQSPLHIGVTAVHLVLPPVTLRVHVALQGGVQTHTFPVLLTVHCAVTSVPRDVTSVLTCIPTIPDTLAAVLASASKHPVRTGMLGPEGEVAAELDSVGRETIELLTGETGPRTAPFLSALTFTGADQSNSAGLEPARLSGL